MISQIKSRVRRLLKATPLKYVVKRAAQASPVVASVQPRAEPEKQVAVKNTDKTIAINDIQFTVDFADQGGKAYAGRSSHEEYASRLYDEIAACLDPRLIIDVGANYGFTGTIFSRRFPGAKIVLVEPSPVLCGYIERNLKANGAGDYQILRAICGAAADEHSLFSINPRSSQDNRVIGFPGWQSIPAPTISLGQIIKDHHRSGNLFIKIDTQGFEERVFGGADAFLTSSNNWLIKTEFAPFCLLSQGTDPLSFLRQLITKFSVIEAPARYRFAGDGLDRLFSAPLTLEISEPFVAHITSLNDRETGWCDLLLRPRG